MRQTCLVLVVAVVAALGCKGAGSNASDGGDLEMCGNGTLDATEVCDDGNTTSGDGCSADCTSDESCGNQVLDTTVGEVCDDGNAVDGDGCSADCRSDETCGNHIIDHVTGETCDDGNSVPADGCSANCQSNESCGNGITDPGEDCDTLNMATATCDPDCTAATCGDGVRNMAANEACDDGNTANNDSCVGCQLSRCGDGFVRTQGASPEQCDDGNTNNNDACKNNCTNNVCGDGVVYQGTEQCDDANSSNTDACLVGCIAARCGDGFVRTGVETCDDGNMQGGDGCSASCQWEPKTYVISTAGMLVNQASDCDGNGIQDNVYDGCNQQPWGFTWADSTPYTPSSITVVLNRGIACWYEVQQIVDLPKATSINGVSTGTFTLSDDPAAEPTLGACQCIPPEREFTWPLSGIGGYVVGGTNTFLLDANPTCGGFSYSENLGGFARVTVYP